ncbi:MAG: glycosyltransferase family 4 protein [Actinomycetota bacterium]
MAAVLHVVASTDRRGAELFGQQLHEALSERGWRSQIVALAAGSGAGLDIESLGPTRRHRRTLTALRRRAAGVDIVVAHGSTTLPVCSLALLASGTPFVYRNIGDPNHWVTTARRRLQGAVLHRRARHIVALTPTTVDRLQAKYRLSAGRITAIPKGVPLESFPPTNPERRHKGRTMLDVADNVPLVVYLGALGPEKLIENAIAAIGDLPSVALAIVGDGPERDRLHALAAPHDPRIRLVGATSEPGLVLAAADLVVQPSATEGLPGTLIEAGLVGVPSVATDVGFVSDIVVDDDVGTLVPPHNVAALRKAIKARLDDDRPVSADARADLMNRYGLDQMVASWETVLRQAISS